jgi:hypothetical protein
MPKSSEKSQIKSDSDGWKQVDKYHLRHETGATISKAFGSVVTYTLWIKAKPVKYSKKLKECKAAFAEIQKAKPLPVDEEIRKQKTALTALEQMKRMGES